MGYDCTLHAIDPKLINGPYTDLILNNPTPDNPLSGLPHAKDTLRAIDEHFRSDSPTNAASAVAQGALVFSAALHPYHYERGFALSLWADQPDGLDATVPEEFLGDVHDLFPRLLAARPDLRGAFENEFTGNYSTGHYVPADRVPEFLQWVRRKVKKYPKPDRRLFRGLLLVLEHAAAHGLAYWEATDLPVEMRTMMPAGRTKGLDEHRLPEGYWDYRIHTGHLLVFSDHRGQSLVLDTRTWPPESFVIPEYCSDCDAASPDGPFLTLAAAGYVDFKIRNQPQRHTVFEIRVRKHFRSADYRVLRLKGLAPPLGPQNSAFFHGRVISEPNYVYTHSKSRVPMYQGNDDLLHPVKGIPPARDSHREPRQECVDLKVMRLNGREVLLWRDKGYELINGTFTPTFNFSHPAVRDGRNYHSSYVPVSDDSAYLLLDRRVALVRRGQKPEFFLPTVTNAMFLSPGPSGSILIDEGDTKNGRLGLIWWPDQDRFVEIDPDLFADEDPNAIRSLFLTPDQSRLLAYTPSRVWSRPLIDVLNCPQYVASTGRKARAASKKKPS